MKRLAAVLGSLTGAVETLNGYRPLSWNGFSSMLAWYYGLVVSELPLQTMATQSGGLATASRWLPRGVRRFAWLVSGLSWLGLLGLYRIARGANAPLTAALDVGLGTDRRTDATAKTPGSLRMMRIYRDYAHDTDISYGEYGKKNLLDICAAPTSTAMAGRRCCCRFRVADGRREANAGKRIR